MPIEPDTKDWTWVLETPCAACGFRSGAVARERVGAAIRSNAAAWRSVLSGPAEQVRNRPADDVWSPLEYACHVRDVHLVFAQRLQLMLDQDDPELAGWDQDAAAVAGEYADRDPATVLDELVAAAASVGALFDAVEDDQWQRTGRRSDGSAFTVGTLGQYQLHDVVHHLHDVGDARRSTVSAYDANAVAYRDASMTMNEGVASEVAWFAAELGSGARVLEVGSGGGRDALALETAGLSVRRTDGTPAFVALLRAEGHEADRLDPLTDALADPRGPEPYDGVWAHASLLHVARDDFPVVLRRLAEATRREGVLHVALKEGEGERWSTHGTIEAPRHFVLWQEAPLREVLEESGWSVAEVVRQQSDGGQAWLVVRGRRR
ncbi:methyltransferase domain-containing protein [Nocardioides sp. JQ2195]|uniref:DinB family protein n=1 Tax=Nocardioides sp. JQ2195 TaxID=2592334 RepID=UPI00143E5665|nr:DinB family protein [Nocardioides sp. JQ2195]QIX26991.1 methyltransferase domain-containing protein [Nocardioides sp. JQ2195]